MRAALLRHRLAVRRTIMATNDAGEKVPTWATVETRWGSIEPLQGRERSAAQQVTPNVSHRIRLRYGSTVTAKDRIAYGGRTFEIDAVLNTREGNRQLELLCTEQP